ncbi:MAG: putative rane protein, partial [Aeromicrobium sp.]|nr:putative rane protein [Aeromicrobium sp.]
SRPVAIDPLRAVVRTAMLCLLVPAVIFDRDGRGLHDRLTDTAVVRG